MENFMVGEFGLELYLRFEVVLLNLLLCGFRFFLVFWFCVILFIKWVEDWCDDWFLMDWCFFELLICDGNKLE